MPCGCLFVRNCLCKRSDVRRQICCDGLGTNRGSIGSAQSEATGGEGKKHLWERIASSGGPAFKLGKYDLVHTLTVSGINLIHQVALSGRPEKACLEDAVIEGHEGFGRQQYVPIDRLRQRDGIDALRPLGQIVAARARCGEQVRHDRENISL